MHTVAKENHAPESNTVQPRDPAAPVTRQARNRLLGLTFVLCALSFALVGLFPNVFYTIIPTHDYLVFHVAFEFMSIVVSFAVFTVGWHGYQQNANKQDLVIGVTFLMVAIIDFAHTLSYNGMPDFLSLNSVSKAATYWMAARLIDAVGIMAAGFILADDRRRWTSPGVLVAGALALVTALIVTVSYYPNVLPAMYIEGMGLTQAKIGLEWLVIALYGLSVYVFGRRGHRETNVVLLQMALIVGIFSELSFTLYRSAYDTYNLLGHVYKVAAYYMIFRALFVSSLQKPYYQLMMARIQTEKSFSQIGAALASSLDLKQVLQLITELASNMLGVKSSTVMLIRDGELQVEAQTGISTLSGTVSTSHTAAGTAVATRKPVVIDDVAMVPHHDPRCHCQSLLGLPARSVLSAPIVAGSEVLGVVEVYSPEKGAFGRKQADLLASFAGQAAAAIKNSITYEREHQIAEMLQRSLLPSVPSIPGLDIAVRYLPSDDVARVGGDLYDVFALDDSRLAVVIGDVSGHGLEAASMMAMTSYTLRGLLLHGMPPGEAFELTNRAFARSCAEMRFVTVFAAVIDARRRTMQYANAGHMMPVVLWDGLCKPMDQQSDLPLGIDESTRYATREADLTGAGGILLYTDGLVEARSHGDLYGEERLISACSEMGGLPAESLIDSLIERSTRHAGMLNDDVACLAVKWDE